METLIEPLRYTTSLFAIATAIVMVNALKGDPRDRVPIVRLGLPWLVLAGGAGWFFSHVTRSLPVAAMVPAGAIVGLALGIAALFSPRVVALFAALDDGQWRMLMLIRAVFGSLLLAAGAAGLLPLAFAVPAGLGDILVGGLAIVAPGSLAAGGHRGSRLLVFGAGLIDLLDVIALQVLVVVPWLADTRSIGISLLLPWVAVPLMATLNLFGMRQVLRELAKGPVTTT